MYYKIENQDCEVYKKLHEMRTNEIQIQKDNEEAIKEKTGLDYKSYWGQGGQQNFWRVTQYSGFKFTEPEKVDFKIWKRQKDNPEIFVPNKKTKQGQEMGKFLQNGLKGSNFMLPLEILNLEEHGRFTFPFVEIVGEIIILYLDDTQEPKDENVIEITKKEFDKIYV